MKYSITLLIVAGAFILRAQPAQKTYCNPMDINYRYNYEQLNDSISYRSGADPVIVNHKGEYFLFVTISGGYWHSKDLVNWKYIVPDKWPMEDMCAPAAISVRDTLYLFQSTFEQRPILFTTTPETGKLYFYNRWLPRLPKDIGPWDPALFYDEELDKWYMYWGSSNVYPIFGSELDKKYRLRYKGSYKELIYLHPEEHGWERFGRDHRSTITPFTEGAWMTKHNGKYYLQYGAPGTEYNVYANGAYIGDHPLGPFTYAPYNPISYKPGGFVTGAGHGNTFQDNYGNYWNTGTPWVAVNWNFERRIAMFPTGFDKDGQMFANTRFGDLPHYLPVKKWQNKDELFTGWMLLSYKKPAIASSLLDTFKVANITDENPRTFWVAKQNKEGESVIVDLQREQQVRAVQVNFTDYKSNIYDGFDQKIYTQFRIYTSRDGKQWNKVVDLTNEKRDRPNAYLELPNAVQARYIKYEHVYVASPNLAISDIRVFGNGDGKIPKTPLKFSAVRDLDTRNAFTKWQKVPGAVGYNILWGIAKDKLYQTYQVFADQPESLEIRALTKDVSYYFAIEAFNENGVSKMSEAIFVK
ncbi:family 43 glycosylhydrolase [Ohtaekwangia koreensis]|uniref:F5/8 type C domain-containing protein n=1 Tax=Ohtaekwangia koreensis TaxID=688867 RepID=A0A1T5MNS9_9BACT|nr:family 43 glycosylhydrolase [Ohtaekwangia koreensis]SKC89683.1 F5/8 type C domain-containing protein [Ohtaekwangia koreensis]